MGKYCAIIIIMVNLKSHIHTKIRNLFSSWLLPARRIHIEFIIESDKVSMYALVE